MIFCSRQTKLPATRANVAFAVWLTSLEAAVDAYVAVGRDRDADQASARGSALGGDNGADNGAEMGVWNLLQQPQREANLALALDEYLRFGLEAAALFVN